MVAAALALAASVLAPGRAGLQPVDVVVDDWTRPPVGATGIPPGWSAYATIGGRPRYDFEAVEADGRRALRVRSRDDHSTIAREVSVDLAATPVLEWTWKVARLPEGADIRRKDTSDLGVQLIVVWPRPPAWLRSRLIAYGWDERLAGGTIEPSRKTRTVTFVIVRSGTADLDRWVTERRNVADDYRKIFGEAPDNPRAVAISIDTNDTHSTAEALVGRIAFTGETGRSEPK